MILHLHGISERNNGNLSEKIYKTQNVTQSAEGNKNRIMDHRNKCGHIDIII